MIIPDDAPNVGMHFFFHAPSPDSLGEDWKGVSGICIEMDDPEIPDPLAYIAELLRFKTKAGIRGALNPMTGERGVIVYVGEANSQESLEGLNSPFIDTPWCEDADIVFATIKRMNRKWCFGVLENDKVHLIYVDNVDIVGRQTWHLESRPETTPGLRRTVPIDTPKPTIN